MALGLRVRTSEEGGLTTSERRAKARRSAQLMSAVNEVILFNPTNMDNNQEMDTFVDFL